jgi:hypothetical protein
MFMAYLSRIDRWLPVAVGFAVLAPFTGLVSDDGRFIPGNDYCCLHAPIRQFARGELLAGRIPLWMPYVSCGAALHAAHHTTLLYAPATLPILLFGANAGIKLALFLHLAFCYCGQYLLARALDISRFAAAFAAAAAAWGTFAMNQLAVGQVTFVIGNALIPWFFLLLLKLFARPGPRSAVALAVTVALFDLGSHPQVLYYALLGGACWTIGWLISLRTVRNGAVTLLWLAAAAAVSVLLSGAQWLPAIELLCDGAAKADRGQTSYAAMYSMDGSDLAQMLVPRLKGDERAGIEPFDWWYDHERGAYLGMMVLPLAAYGLSRSSAARWQWGAGWLCLAAAEIALAEQSPFWEFFCAAMPGLVWFRCQGRIFSVVGIVAALAASRGLDALVRGERQGGPRSLCALLGFAAAASAVLGDSLRRWLARIDWDAYLNYASVHLRDEYFNLGALVVAVAVVLVSCRAVGRDFPRTGYLLAIVTLMGDLHEFNVRDFQLVPPPYFSRLTAPDGRPERFVFAPDDLRFTRTSLQYSLAVAPAVHSKVPAVNTFDGAVLPGAVSRLYEALERDPRPALALAACDWIYIQSSGNWRRIPNALPRFRFVRGPAAALCAQPIGRCGEDDVRALLDGLSGTVDVRLEEPRRLEFDVDAPDEGMFVVADIYYPGWRATVDGQHVEVVPAHGVFRGIRLECGNHRVVLLYDPWSFKTGCGLSACGIAGLLALLWLTMAHRAGSVGRQATTA